MNFMVNYQDTTPMFREYGLPLMVFMGGTYDKIYKCTKLNWGEYCLV